MTKQETIQVLQTIEDRAVDFPYMTACDWVAIAAAKRHLEYSLEVKDVDLEKEIKNEIDEYWYDNDYGAIQRYGGTITMEVSDVKEIAKHFYELGLKAQKGEEV